jgi:hypothetical protein
MLSRMTRSRPLISPSYRDLNADLHETVADYGVNGGRFADALRELAQANGWLTILDYGCGKGSLKVAMAQIAGAITVLEFDPAIAGKDILPAVPVDIVAALDVMEHIEPDYLDGVLTTIRELKPRCVFLVISTQPARKVLSDGRNAHLIVEPKPWWLARLAPYFRVLQAIDGPGQFTFIGVPVRG